MAISIIKSKLPPLENWEEMEIVECIGTPEEHADKFYRYGNQGIEVHPDGLCQAYVIVNGDDGEEPIMVKEGLDSPETVIEFLNEESNGKALSDSKCAEEDSEECCEEDPKAEDEAKTEVTEVEIEIVPEEKDNKSEESKMTDEIKTPEKETESVAKAETIAHSGTVQEAHNSGSSNGGTDDITHAGTVEEQNVGTSNGGIDDITHAKKVTLPHAQVNVGIDGGKTSVPAGPTFKSFAEMRAEREGRKQRGLPNGYTPYNEATVRKTANDNAQKGMYKFGTGKEYIDGSEVPDAKVNQGVEGASRKTKVAGFAKSAGDYEVVGLMPFSSIRKSMRTAGYVPGTVDVRAYSPIAKADAPPMPPEDMGDEEPMDDPMPMAGGDGLTDALGGTGQDLPVDAPEMDTGLEDSTMDAALGGSDVADIGEGAPADEVMGAPGEEAAIGGPMAPEQVAQAYAAADPFIQDLIASLLTPSGGEGGIPPSTEGEGIGEGVAPEAEGGPMPAPEPDMGAVPGAEDMAPPTPDMGAGAPVPDPTLAQAEKPQMPGL